MSESEHVPHTNIQACLVQLHALAEQLAPTDVVQELCERDTALVEHPKLRQYVTGTEHLELAIAYLERAIADGKMATLPTPTTCDSVNNTETLDYRHYQL